MMATRINLLPWREARRKQRQQAFGFLMGGALAIGVAIVVGANLYTQNLIDDQRARNRFLEGEIKKLDAVAKEIDLLETQRERLKARLAVIERLQLSRPFMVQVLDEFARRLPDTLFLRRFATDGAVNLLIVGTAVDTDTVSTAMRSLEASEIFGEASLRFVENKEIPVGNTSPRLSEFEILMPRVMPKAPNAEDADQVVN